MKFTWIQYYKEFAEKLLRFRNDRKPLLKLIASIAAAMIAPVKPVQHLARLCIDDQRCDACIFAQFVHLWIIQ